MRMSWRAPTGPGRLAAWSVALALAGAACALAFDGVGEALTLSWATLMSLCGS